MSVAKINEAVAAYFEKFESENWIPAKKIMYYLIEAGVFTKDVKKGLPLRKILRQLDADDKLDSIPSIHAERIQGKIYWYFVREGATYEPKEVINTVSKKERGALGIENSDEFYLVNLCDQILKQKASRKHTFDNLLGNLHKKGKGRTKLTLAGYYDDLKLAIDFVGKEPASEERARQLRNYGLRKKEVLDRKKIKFIQINYSDFECNDEQKLIRDTEADIQLLNQVLKNYR